MHNLDEYLLVNNIFVYHRENHLDGGVPSFTVFSTRGGRKKSDSPFGDHALSAFTRLSPFILALPCFRCHTVALIALLPYDREGTCSTTLAQILVVPIQIPTSAIVKLAWDFLHLPRLPILPHLPLILMMNRTNPPPSLLSLFFRPCMFTPMFLPTCLMKNRSPSMDRLQLWCFHSINPWRRKRRTSLSPKLSLLPLS